MSMTMTEQLTEMRSADLEADETLYTELLSRHSSPQAKDAGKLAGLLSRLGRTPEQFRADAAAIVEADRLERGMIPADEIKQLADEMARTAKAVEELRDVKLPEAQEVAYTADMQHSNATRGNREAIERIAKLKKLHPLAFGLKPVAADPPPSVYGVITGAPRHYDVLPVQ